MIGKIQIKHFTKFIAAFFFLINKEEKEKEMQGRLNVEQKWRVRNQDLRISTEEPANLWVTLGARRLLELG